MTSTSTSPAGGLPELPDEAVHRIEEDIFAQIAEERAGARGRTILQRRSRRRGWLTASGIAAAFAVGVLLTPAALSLMPSGVSGSAVAPTGVLPGTAPLSDTAKAAPSSGDSSAASSSASATRDIARTGSATVQVHDVQGAAAGLRSLAERHGGYVQSQQLGAVQPPVATDGIVPLPQGDGWVVLRVPAADLSAVLDALREEGSVLATSIGQDDVTATATDLRAQVASLTASVDRLTQLMSQAGSVADLLTAETALTDRQSQLQSAQQQLTSIESEVAMASVQITLVREQSATTDSAGFGDGLTAGWRSLVVSLNALVIAVGFVLPWLMVGLVLALIVWGLIRLRRARHARAQRPDLAE